jgi:hypothetical protein
MRSLRFKLDDGSSVEIVGAEITALSAALWGLADTTPGAVACVAELDYMRHQLRGHPVELPARESQALRKALTAVRGD